MGAHLLEFPDYSTHFLQNGAACSRFGPSAEYIDWIVLFEDHVFKPDAFYEAGRKQLLLAHLHDHSVILSIFEDRGGGWRAMVHNLDIQTWCPWRHLMVRW
jgi:hypothetical protein